MNVFDILDHEHQMIAPALRAAQAYALRMAHPGASVEPAAQELIGFFNKFVSQCHQVKEYHLFICLLQKGRSYVIAPIASLHAEHSRLARMTESLDAAWQWGVDGHAGACELVAGYFTDYAALMDAHILKEDRFYRVTESILETADHLELGAAFDRLEQETLGADRYKDYGKWTYRVAV